MSEFTARTNSQKQGRELSPLTKTGEFCIELSVFGKEFCDPRFECTSNVFCEDIEKCDNYDEDLDCDIIKFTCDFADLTFCEEYFTYDKIEQVEEIESEAESDEDKLDSEDLLEEDFEDDETAREDDSIDEIDDPLEARLNLELDGEG